MHPTNTNTNTITIDPSPLCGVAENHRTIKIIIKGHAAVAVVVVACYAKCPNGIVSHGGWLARKVDGVVDGVRD